MIVVADTSPLNYLVLLGQADLLHAVYGRVVVPLAVLIEMQHPEAPPVVRNWAGAPPPWLDRRRPAEVAPTLNPALGAGEREAISLALELQADILLIDERAGRMEAEARDIQVAGTLAVLLLGAIRGHINFPEAIAELRRHGFRLSHKVELAMLERYERLKSTQP